MHHTAEATIGESLEQARIDLAAALRLAARFGLHEGIDNHFSYALPGGDNRFLLNPYGLHFSEVSARDLLLADQEGRVLEGDGELEISAFTIHSQIHLRHPRAACVLHTHMPYATALTAIEDGRLEPVNQNALRFYGDIAYDDDYNGLSDDIAEGARMAAAMGDKRILFLANHGVVVTAESIGGAFDDLYFLERACQVQVLAMATGKPLKRVSPNMAAHTSAGFGRNKGASHGAAHFAALKRQLDREDPSYAD